LLAKLAAGAKVTTCWYRPAAVQALIKGGQLTARQVAAANLKNINPIYLNTPFDPGNQIFGALRCRRRSSATTTSR
jgi:hypothetical protein